MDFKDFKSSCRALITSEVGSIPTRSRQRFLRAGGVRCRSSAEWITVALVTVAILAPKASAEEGPAPGSKAPRSAATPVTTVLRSAACPGWGQLENGQPLKSIAVFGAETGLLASGFVELRRAERSREAQDRAAARGDAAGAAEEYQRYLDRRDRGISRFWWAGFALLLSMLDAYTDAHLRDFHTGVELPAPEESPSLPAAPASPAGPGRKPPAPEDGAGLEPSAAASLIVDAGARRVGIAFVF